MKVTDKGDEMVFLCDFSPPRGADIAVLERAKRLDADFICVAYNPGRAVRVDSAMLAYSIKQQTGKDVIFNLATRDMNKLALQTHLLGAQMLGLENLVIVQGDGFTAKDRERVKGVDDFSPTGLLRALAAMNEGTDFRGSTLRVPTEFCIGASIDLSRDIKMEAELTHRKILAGADFFITQPVFSAEEIKHFLEAYRAESAEEIGQPIFFGLQILEKDGVLFSSVPEAVRQELEKGRDGADIALEQLQEFQDLGIKRIYLVPPILKGGARNYESAQRVLEGSKPG